MCDFITYRNSYLCQQMEVTSCILQTSRSRFMHNTFTFSTFIYEKLKLKLICMFCVYIVARDNAINYFDFILLTNGDHSPYYK